MLLLQGEKSNRKQTAWIKFQSLLTIALAFTNLNIESASTSCMMMQPASVVVIGGTGTLGAAITRSLCSSEIHQVYSSYRSQSQKKASDIVTSITNMPMSSSMKRPKWFQFDLEESSKAKELDLPGFGQCSPFPHHVLLNCAGVCLHGHTREILERSLRVNTLGPIETSKSMIKYEDTDTFKKEKEKEKEEEKKAKEKEKKEEKNKNKKMKSVVNISSGDGELLYINSKIVKDLESILILEDLELYISNLCSSYDHSFEYDTLHGITLYKNILLLFIIYYIL